MDDHLGSMLDLAAARSKALVQPGSAKEFAEKSAKVYAKT